MAVRTKTGLRLAELTNLRYHSSDPDLNDVDLDTNPVTVVGKGSHIRVVRIGAKAVRAVDRYLRSRTRHLYADLPWLWLAQEGQLTDSGIYQMIRRRAREAGLPPINPHQCRHIFAHRRSTAAAPRRPHAPGRLADPPDGRTLRRIGRSQPRPSSA